MLPHHTVNYISNIDWNELLCNHIYTCLGSDSLVTIQMSSDLFDMNQDSLDLSFCAFTHVSNYDYSHSALFMNFYP